MEGAFIFQGRTVLTFESGFILEARPRMGYLGEAGERETVQAVSRGLAGRRR